MAREGCNLDKDEAELLKVPPSSSSSSSPTPPPGPQSSQPTLFMKPPPQDLAIQMGSGSRKQEADPHLPPRVPPQGPSGPCCKRKAPPEAEAEAECPPPARAAANRCCSCQRKVGLMGFRCRCGDLFCSRHRYSDAHGCSYDYKAAGREEIARNNPVVRAAKIIRI